MTMASVLQFIWPLTARTYLTSRGTVGRDVVRHIAISFAELIGAGFKVIQTPRLRADIVGGGALLFEQEHSRFDDTYQPRASTPLIDACVEAIKTTEELVAQRKDRSRVIVVFQTDGEENASRRHQLADLVDLIKRRSDEGWKFVFLGANIDAYKTARAFGIADEATVAYDARRSGMLMEEAGVLTALLAMGSAEELVFHKELKRAAGDRFDPDATAAASDAE